MFAATAATIVSGAVAERVKLNSFLIFSVIYVMLVYPVVGSWGWGGGWLNDLTPAFHDFAGSTFVHSVGGWAALAGVIFLGPRLGKYVNGQSKPIMGHNMPLAAIGVFLLWLGWFGFNGGSVLSADPVGVSYVFVTTTLAAAAGIVAAMLTSWWVQKKPDLSMVLNGCLAGLVGITAGADVVSLQAAIIIGLVSGILVVLAVLMFDALKLDDPVGALSVHLVCGVWGTLAVGLFSPDFSFKNQLIGVAAAGALCFVAASVIFAVLRCTVKIRVSEHEELRGLDLGEHGMEAYSGFQIFSTQ
jgi:Amt family ammonium transporter